MFYRHPDIENRKMVCILLHYRHLERETTIFHLEEKLMHRPCQQAHMETICVGPTLPYRNLIEFTWLQSKAHEILAEN